MMMMMMMYMLAPMFLLSNYWKSVDCIWYFVSTSKFVRRIQFDFYPSNAMSM